MLSRAARFSESLLRGDEQLLDAWEDKGQILLVDLFQDCKCTFGFRIVTCAIFILHLGDALQLVPNLHRPVSDALIGALRCSFEQSGHRLARPHAVRKGLAPDGVKSFHNAAAYWVLSRHLILGASAQHLFPVYLRCAAQEWVQNFKPRPNSETRADGEALH